MKNLLKSKKGITLVALVITVIVMLILAGVAISVVVDGEGLFSRTRQAVGEYENSVAEESSQVQTLINSVDKYLNKVSSEVKLEITDLDATMFTLKATASNITEEITKYEFYIDDSLVTTIETSDAIAEYNVTGKERDTEYKCSARMYTTRGEYIDSNVINIKTDVIATGDFVNYSVVVDEAEYNKWRILHKDMNGRMEIVCYNGPEYTIGSSDNEEKAKSDYANCIYLLNEASKLYGEGTFAYETRHLGSNPTNPSAYANISEEYIYCGVEDNEYIIQEHHGTDMKSIEKFSGEKKLYAIYTWLASRWVNVVNSSESTIEFGFRTRCVSSGGELSSKYFYRIDSLGNKVLGGQHYALAPVVSLEEGVVVNTAGNGSGSEENPWELIKE